MIKPFFQSDEYRAFYDNKRFFARIAAVARPIARRFLDIRRARSADLILVQREAMLFGPAFFEWLYRVGSGKPMILDLDDAVYIPYKSPKYGRLGSYLKFFGKTENLIKKAELVICGGRYLADFARSLGCRSFVIPTVVDGEKFLPTENENDPLVIGWIGTASTFPYLQKIFPALQRLSKRHDFVLRLRGTGQREVHLDGVNVDNAPWKLETEIADFRSIDIGLYPLIPTEEMSLEWLEGKSGFKAIQYLSLGIPYVVSPVGVAAEFGLSGETHFEARTIDEWESQLEKLLTDPGLRRRMGKSGREHSEKEFSLEKWTSVLSECIREIASSRRSPK